MKTRAILALFVMSLCPVAQGCGSQTEGAPGASSDSTIGFGMEGADSTNRFSVDIVGGGDSSSQAGIIDTGNPGVSPGCVEGATQLCLCAPEVQGIQVCQNDSTWGPCHCDTPNTGVDTTSSKPDAGNNVPQDTNSPPPDDGASGADDNSQCNARTKQVYLLSSTKQLLRFDPNAMQISTVGTLNCPDASPPFSMSVDNFANAWILYQPGDTFSLNFAGKIYKASTIDASCESTSFIPGNVAGFDLFGMGFVADAAGSMQETLFVAGASFTSMFDLLGNPAANVNANLGSMKTLGLTLTHLATLTGGMGTPELTGTGKGELWGFFPSASPPVIAQIDKTTGEILQTHDLTSLNISQTQSWAFVAWGGDFYLFLKTATDVNSKVWKVDGVSGDTSLAIDNSGYSIVGAGVSICAPTE